VSIGSSIYDSVRCGTWNGRRFSSDEMRLFRETHSILEVSRWTASDVRKYLELVQRELAIEAQR
jgi:hypothetical protein